MLLEVSRFISDAEEVSQIHFRPRRFTHLDHAQQSHILLLCPVHCPVMLNDLVAAGPCQPLGVEPLAHCRCKRVPEKTCLENIPLNPPMMLVQEVPEHLVPSHEEAQVDVLQGCDFAVLAAGAAAGFVVIVQPGKLAVPLEALQDLDLHHVHPVGDSVVLPYSFSSEENMAKESKHTERRPHLALLPDLLHQALGLLHPAYGLDKVVDKFSPAAAAAIVGPTPSEAGKL